MKKPLFIGFFSLDFTMDGAPVPAVEGAASARRRGPASGGRRPVDAGASASGRAVSSGRQPPLNRSFSYLGGVCHPGSGQQCNSHISGICTESATATPPLGIRMCFQKSIRWLFHLPFHTHVHHFCHLRTTPFLAQQHRSMISSYMELTIHMESAVSVTSAGTSYLLSEFKKIHHIFMQIIISFNRFRKDSLYGRPKGNYQ